MILITDSGSTKCDWIAIDKTGKRLAEKIRTKGLNPAILTEEELKSIISGSEELMRYKSEVTHNFLLWSGLWYREA